MGHITSTSRTACTVAPLALQHRDLIAADDAHQVSPAGYDHTAGAVFAARKDAVETMACHSIATSAVGAVFQLDVIQAATDRLEGGASENPVADFAKIKAAAEAVKAWIASVATDELGSVGLATAPAEPTVASRPH